MAEADQVPWALHFVLVSPQFYELALFYLERKWGVSQIKWLDPGPQPDVGSHQDLSLMWIRKITLSLSYLYLLLT